MSNAPERIWVHRVIEDELLSEETSEHVSITLKPTKHCKYGFVSKPLYDAQAAENERLREALKPFQEISRELFARNFNKGDLVLKLSCPQGGKLTFEHFLDAHYALTTTKEGE